MDEAGTHDEYSNKTQHPQAMHLTENYTRDSTLSYAYASIPEVAGKFYKLDNTLKKEGFLEFYVYNVYKRLYPVYIKKADADDITKTLPGVEFD